MQCGTVKWFLIRHNAKPKSVSTNFKKTKKLTHFPISTAVLVLTTFLALTTVTALTSFQVQTTEKNIVGTYCATVLGKDTPAEIILTLKKDFSFKETVYPGNPKKCKRSGFWVLKGDTVVFDVRKDDCHDCGYNANYYDKQCPDETYIFKDNSLWTIKPSKKKYTRK